MSKEDAQERQPWERMTVTPVGDVTALVQNTGGQGKSGTAADPGDPLKPPGQT